MLPIHHRVRGEEKEKLPRIHRGKEYRSLENLHTPASKEEKKWESCLFQRSKKRNLHTGPRKIKKDVGWKGTLWAVVTDDLRKKAVHSVRIANRCSALQKLLQQGKGKESGQCADFGGGARCGGNGQVCGVSEEHRQLPRHRTSLRPVGEKIEAKIGPMKKPGVRPTN